MAGAMAIRTNGLVFDFMVLELLGFLLMDFDRKRVWGDVTLRC